MRRILCWLITGHGRARIEWESVGHADRLVKRCLTCGRIVAIPAHEYRDRSRRDFGW